MVVFLTEAAALACLLASVVFGPLSLSYVALGLCLAVLAALAGEPLLRRRRAPVPVSVGEPEESAV